MEEKHLDLNQPFLSVRRFPPTVPASEVENKRKTDDSYQKVPSLPFYKSDLKSGPIRNPGTVPFVWEKIPGRPKDERQSQSPYLRQFPAAPKLPPGRIVNVKQELSCKGLGEPINDAPEQIKAHSTSTKISSSDENVNDFETAKEGSVEKHSCGSEDGDEAYVDALDTLSRSESFFLNCSLSGLSGLDAPDIKPSGTHSTDSQARDFMMDRFLPAAKAIASETPPHVFRKQPIVRDETRQIKKVVIRDKHPPVYQYKPNVIRDYDLNHNAEDSEDEDEDYDEPGNLSGKVCGLLPRFCLNNSLCLSNPVSEMKIRAHGTSVRRVHSIFSTAGSCRQTQNERNATNQGRSMLGRTKNELHEDRSNIRSELNHPTNPNNCREPDLSLNRRLQGSDVSPNCQESSQSPFHEKTIQFLGIPGEAKNLVNGHANGRTFQDLLADPSTAWDSGSSSPVVEKTLYIDSIHMFRSPNSSSCSVDIKTLSDFKENNFKDPSKSEGMAMLSNTDSSLQDVNHLNTADGKTDFQLQLDSFVSRSTQEMQMETEKCPRQGRYLTMGSVTSTGSNISDNWKADLEKEQPQRAERKEKSYGTNPLLPLPPPLPKSPSESWLCRTLPHVSARNISSRPYLVSHMQHRQEASNTINHTKCEPVVTQSKAHYGHLHFPEEMLTPIPET